MNRHICWRDGRSRVYPVEVGQEQNINIGYPAALSAAGELRPVGVDAADLVPGIVARLCPAVTPDGQSLAEVHLGTALISCDNTVSPALLLRDVGVTADGVVTELVDGVNKLGRLVEFERGSAGAVWVEVG